MRLGDARDVLIFGGTFDPPHLGHARLPPLVAEQLGSDCIVYVPARVSPHKVDSPPTADHHRMAMLQLAIADIPNAIISSVELERPGPSYMIDTVRALRASHHSDTEVTWRLLLGADQALTFDTWRDWQSLLELAAPAVMLRPPHDRDSFAIAVRERFEPAVAARLLGAVVDVPQIDISATQLRRRLAAGGEVSDWMNPAVLDYIEQNGLYGTGSHREQ